MFEAMFTHDMSENRSSRVCIEDLDPDTVYDMISYIYSGRVGYTIQCHFNFSILDLILNLQYIKTFWT